MAANVLNSPKAVKMSVFVVRAFMKMREHLLSRAELEVRLAQIENVLLSHDDKIQELYRQIRPLLLPPPEPPPQEDRLFRPGTSSEVFHQEIKQGDKPPRAAALR